MALPDNTNPQQVMDQSVQDQINKMFANGDIQPEDMKGWPPAKPPGGWNVNAFAQLLTQVQPKTQSPFAGGNAAPTLQGSGSAIDQANALVGGAEGYSSKAYNGVNNPNRKSSVTIQPGQFPEGQAPSSSNEVSIGYGWNMTRSDTAQVFQKLFNFGPDQLQQVKNGQLGLDQQQATQLREYALGEVQNQLQAKLGPDVHLRDHQMAALMSLGYNMGVGGLAKTGLLQFIRDGATDAQVADRIRTLALGPNNQQQNRRNHEAATYLGAQSQKYYAGINANQLPGEQIATADINPQDRH